MDWSFIIKWLKKIWQSFIDSLGTPVTPIKPPVTDSDSTPVPIPDPPPPWQPVYRIVVADMDLIPARMRQAGFDARDGALYYALAVIYSGGSNSSPPSDGETWILFQRRDEINNWWDWEIKKVADQLKANPGLTAKIIEHDGRIDGAERLGCRLVRPTMERLAEFGDRVQPGDVFPEEGYA